jgi:hypothetical protein
VSTRRPSPETLESLRATLQQLEQTNDPADESFPELKRIILARIADLELARRDLLSAYASVKLRGAAS